MRKQEIDEKFDEIVKFAEIDQFIETPVKRYSSGMYVRLAFAVAAHLDTEILLVDEVLAVGDAAFQRKCLGKMGEVSQEGKTILFVSHNMPAIENLCTRGILLSSGKIIRDSDAKSVINSYLNQTLSRKLLASKSINNNFELSFFTLTDNNQCCDIFKTGDNILFSAEILVPNPIKQTGFGIIINNSRGEKIVIFHNHFECTEFTPVKTKGKFLIEWSQNVLSPGDYSIDALLHDGSMMVAKWDNIGIFTIIPSDYFHTGKFPDPSYYGSIISRTKWKFFNLDSNYSSLV
jgi:lipopolysaccharide transport system ATP-binding protein